MITGMRSKGAALFKDDSSSGEITPAKPMDPKDKTIKITTQLYLGTFRMRTILGPGWVLRGQHGDLTPGPWSIRTWRFFFDSRKSILTNLTYLPLTVEFASYNQVNHIGSKSHSWFSHISNRYFLACPFRPRNKVKTGHHSLHTTQIRAGAVDLSQDLFDFLLFDTQYP